MKHLPYNLYKRRTNRGTVWHVRFWNEAAERFVKTVSCQTSNKAKARDVAEDMLKRGVVAGDDDPILVPYLRDFWKSDSMYARAKALRGQELSPRYLALCAGAVRRDIEPYTPFADLHVSAVTPGVVERWMLWLGDQGKGTRTINIALQAIRTAVRKWARSRRLSDPLEGMQKAAERSRERGSLSLSEIQALIKSHEYLDKDRKEHPIDARVRAGVLLGCLAGLRLGECRGLRWEDVDEERGIIRVAQSVPAFERTPRKPKWGSTGEVPAPSILVEELQELAAGSPFGRSGYVLYNADEGSPIGTELLRNGFTRMLSAIGINKEVRVERHLSFHSLRHTFVSLSRMAGIPDFLVQRYARHRSAAMMEQYSHVEIVDFEEARKKIAAAVSMTKRAKGSSRGRDSLPE
ncbi:MAG: site-specific integrase [Spirochaetia bacterium]|jgi:integrase